MGKLKMSLVENDIIQQSKVPTFSLRKRRKRPLHPNQVYDLLAEKHNKEVPKIGWKYPYGWTIILIDELGKKHFRSTHSKATYQNAIQLRDEELEFGNFVEAWIIEKTNNKV